MFCQLQFSISHSGRLFSAACLAPGGKVGAEDWNRTSDTSIFSAVLYRLSYLGTP
jgi:hypothetical protein